MIVLYWCLWERACVFRISACLILINIGETVAVDVHIASIPRAVTIEICLKGIWVDRAVVTVIRYAIIILIGSSRLGCRVRIIGVSTRIGLLLITCAVAINVRVADIANAVTVEVALVTIRVIRTIVVPVLHAIVIAIVGIPATSA